MRALVFLLVLAVAARVVASEESVPVLEKRVRAMLHDEELTPRRKVLKELVAKDDAEAAAALLRLYEGAPSQVKRDLLYFLKELKNPDVAPALRPHLSSKDKGLREAVSKVLAELGDEASAPHFRRAAFDENASGWERRQALEALGKTTRSLDDARRFVQLLKDRELKSGAQQALRGLRHPGLAPALYPGLVDEELHPNVRGELCEVLGRLANPHAAVPLLDVVEREENFQLRQEAAEALVTTLEPEHLPRLRKLLSRSHGSTVSGYLWRAWVQADRRQGFELTRALFRSDEDLALQAVYTARSSAHPSDEVLGHLALAGKEHTLQAAGADLLSTLDSESAERMLCQVLSDRRRPFQARAAAATGLGRFRTDASLTCLIQTMPGEKIKDDRSSTWVAMRRSLEKLTGEKLGDDYKAWRTWHEGGLKKGLDGLLEGLSHDDAAVRALAAERLRDHSTKNPKDRRKASAALVRALDEENNEEARAKLAAALGAAGDREAIAALVRALDKAREFETRVALARALDRLGDARGTLHFLDALGSSVASERAEAVRGLSLLTGEPAHHDVERWRAWWREYAERYRRE